jgi:hypothetical protein
MEPNAMATPTETSAGKTRSGDGGEATAALAEAFAITKPDFWPGEPGMKRMRG